MCVNNSFKPASQILPMDINKLCVGISEIFPSLYFWMICGNANAHSLVDVIFPPFGRPTMIWIFWMPFFHLCCLV